MKLKTRSGIEIDDPIFRAAVKELSATWEDEQYQRPNFSGAWPKFRDWMLKSEQRYSDEHAYEIFFTVFNTWTNAKDDQDRGQKLSKVPVDPCFLCGAMHWSFDAHFISLRLETGRN